MQLAHADHRSAEILTLVRQAFVDKGFDGASMQDLARAAGMSVGNFYRYFPSKAAIIQALIAHDLAEIERDFQTIIGSGQPFAALREGMRNRMADTGCGKDKQLWAEIDAAARRSPEIGTASRQMEAAVIAAMISVFAAETGLTQLQAQDRFSVAAAFIVVLFKAASCMNIAQTHDQGELKAMIMRTIDQTLDDVALSRKV